MGSFIYDVRESPFELDDRTLAHLRIVVMNKLRRNESFMMTFPTPERGERWFWVHPSIPVAFAFFGGRAPSINREWIEELMRSANSSNGLVVTPEPPAGG